MSQPDPTQGPTAADVMQTEVVTLHPDTAVQSAVEMLLDRGYSGAPVVDADRRLLGMLSEKDCLVFLSAAAYHRTPVGTVGDVMQRELVTALPTTSLFRLTYLLYEHSFRRVPVVDDDGRLVGLVTRQDVIRALDALRRQHDRQHRPTTYDLLRERREHDGS